MGAEVNIDQIFLLDLCPGDPYKRWDLSSTGPQLRGRNYDDLLLE